MSLTDRQAGWLGITFAVLFTLLIALAVFSSRTPTVYLDSQDQVKGCRIGVETMPPFECRQYMDDGYSVIYVDDQWSAPTH